MGAEYLFDGASAVLLAYDPLKPHNAFSPAPPTPTRVAASNAYLATQKKTAVASLTSIPDAYKDTFSIAPWAVREQDGYGVVDLKIV